MKKKAALLAIASLGLVALVAARSAKKRPMRVVPTVDLERYAGTWYEIARLPNRFQKVCAGETTANYAPEPDGSVTVVNCCQDSGGQIREATGTARRVSEDLPNSILEVRFAPAALSFLPFVWGDYQIIALADDYTHAMVGTPDREYLWILSRTPQLAEATYQQLLEAAQEQGFDTSRLLKTRQSGA